MTALNLRASDEGMWMTLRMPDGAKGAREQMCEIGPSQATTENTNPAIPCRLSQGCADGQGRKHGGFRLLHVQSQTASPSGVASLREPVPVSP